MVTLLLPRRSPSHRSVSNKITSERPPRKTLSSHVRDVAHTSPGTVVTRTSRWSQWGAAASGGAATRSGSRRQVSRTRRAARRVLKEPLSHRDKHWTVDSIQFTYHFTYHFTYLYLTSLLFSSTRVLKLVTALFGRGAILIPGTVTQRGSYH